MAKRISESRSLLELLHILDMRYHSFHFFRSNNGLKVAIISSVTSTPPYKTLIGSGVSSIISRMGKGRSRPCFDPFDTKSASLSLRLLAP